MNNWHKTFLKASVESGQVEWGTAPSVVVLEPEKQNCVNKINNNSNVKRES